MRSEGEEWSVMCPRPTVRVFAFLFMVLFAAVHIYGALEPVDEAGSSQELVFSKGNYSRTARKLLANISSTDSSYTLAIKPNLYTLSRHISDKAHKTENDYGDGEPGDGSGYDNNRQNGSPDSGDGNNNNGGDGSPDGGADDNNGGDGSMNRVGTVPPCSKDSILVYQGATSPLPNGIPTYTVEIQNVCLTESCRISDIHLSCGWFSSARLVNPRVFRRIGYDDCLVNDGGAVTPGEVLSFQYANTFQYPLSVSSVSC